MLRERGGESWTLTGLLSLKVYDCTSRYYDSNDDYDMMLGGHVLPV